MDPWCGFHLRRGALTRMPKIVIKLHAEPNLSAAATIYAEPSFDTARHLWRNRCMLIEHAGECGTRYA